MKKFFFVLLIIIIFINIISCDTNNTIILKAIVDDYVVGEQIYIKEVPQNSAELFITISFGKIIKSMEGFDKLTKLKKLYLSGLSGLNDFSFIKSFKEIEVLIIQGNTIENFSFLKELKKLKILFLIGPRIKNNILDLSNNLKIEFISINNLSYDPPGKYFYLQIPKIPDSLKYFDLTRTRYLEKDISFFKKLENINLVWLDKNYQIEHEVFFYNKENFKFESPVSFINQYYSFDKQEFDVQFYMYEGNQVQ